jgi:16S rRNA (uracil1498-N3)-methyltransferase
MKAPAVLVPAGSLGDGAVIELDDAEQHHLRVRRISQDHAVVVLDGQGRSAHATIAFRGRLVVVEVGTVHLHAAPPATVLAVGAGDRERFVSLAERCTELNVARLVPLQTERAQAVDNRVRDSTLDKARRRAREACKQSGNPWAAQIDEPCTLQQLAVHHAGMRWLLAAIDGASCPPLDSATAVGWIVGPEGGLTADEAEFARTTLAALPVTLGCAILRFDTAAIVAAGLSLDRRWSLTE